MGFPFIPCNGGVSTGGVNPAQAVVADIVPSNYKLCQEIFSSFLKKILACYSLPELSVLPIADRAVRVLGLASIFNASAGLRLSTTSAVRVNQNIRPTVATT